MPWKIPSSSGNHSHMDTTVSILSLGHAASMLGAGPQRIEQAAKALGVTPALRINNVDHYREHDIERIGEYLQSLRRAGL